MSSWISFDGGIAKVTPLRYEDADQSVNRLPTERSTSAVEARALPQVDAVSPIVRPARSCVSSIAPLPFHVVTTGAPSRSARAVTSAQASARIAPPPATMTGRSRRAKQVRRAFHVVRRRPNPAAGLAPRRIRQDDLRGLGLDVHRQVQEDGPGPAGQHRVPGPMEDEGQVVDARRLPPFLDDRLEDSRVVGVMAAVELLEDAVAAHVGVGRAGDEWNGRRIDVGRAHADDGVHRTRADARERQHRPAARAEVAVRKMDGRLFVHHLDRPDAVRSVEQGVGDGPAAVAGNPGREFNVASDEKLDDDLGAGKGALARIAQRSGVSRAAGSVGR